MNRDEYVRCSVLWRPGMQGRIHCEQNIRTNAQIRGSRHSLPPNFTKVQRSRDTDHDVGARLLAQTRYNERQALPLAPVRQRARGHLVAHGFDKPHGQSRQHAGVSEQFEVGALREDDDSVTAHTADVVFVDDGRALADDGSVERHGEL